MVRALAFGTVLLAIVPPHTLDCGRAVQDRGVAALTADLSAADPETRARAACELRELGDGAATAVQPLTALLSDGAPVDPGVCRRRWWRGETDLTSPGELAAAALVAIGTRSIDPLLATLTSPSSIGRRHAAWALGALDDPRAEVPLTRLLQDSEARVREQAAWALGVLDAGDAVGPLTAALKDPDARVRKQAAWALGVVDAPEAVPALVSALSDQHADVRQQAAWALGVIGDKGGLNGLLSALKDPEPQVRRQAAWAIGVIGK
jgi:HEAT repeat protein